jgi:hypothetical protein
MKLFLQSTLKPDLRFEIISFDPATNRGMLKSLTYGSEFEESLDKEHLTRLGYRVEKIEEGEEHA